MLPNNAIVEQVYSGPDGILSSIKEVGMVVVNDFSLLIYRSYYINNWMGFSLCYEMDMFKSNPRTINGVFNSKVSMFSFWYDYS